MTISRPLALWTAILALAVLNGVLREAVLSPLLGPALGRAASGILLAGIVLAVAFAGSNWARLDARPWTIGLLWLALTLVFEFAFGWARGETWLGMLRSYTFKGGNLWPLVLLTTFCAPRLTQARPRTKDYPLFRP